MAVLRASPKVTAVGSYSKKATGLGVPRNTLKPKPFKFDPKERSATAKIKG